MAKKSKTVRVSVSLPAKLLSELDRRIVSKGYSSRSEFVRDLIREQIVHDKWENETEEVVGVLTISYDHHQRGLADKLISVQHRKYINVLCNTHVHMDHHNCLETIIIKGLPPEIERLAIEIGGLKGVRFAKLTRASSVDM
ncbi:nickel-responsive transcriptional regulator NikR [bacterium]|nr:nickel-responsive transcriptional regulator NikR [bacterium]